VSERTHDLLRLAADAEDAERAEILQEVVLLNLGIAERAARRYRNRGVPEEDLLQVARLGLVKAAYGFDASKGATFLGYAIPTVLGELRRYFRDKAWMVRPPRRIQELQAELSERAEHCAQLHGHLATRDELADSTGRRAFEVGEAMAADGCYMPRSLDWDAGDGPSLGEVVGQPEHGFEQVEAIEAIQGAVRQLSPRERRLIYLRFFEEQTQAEIAKEFGVTQMQISRLLRRVLGRMRDRLAA
jgi:RNA polymerase sigma-B factor